MKNSRATIPTLRLLAALALPMLFLTGVAYALGTLTPPTGTPAATSYTLDDIYTRLTTNATATAGDHTLSTGAAPGTTFHTLSEIYSAIPTISAASVANGTSYLGVTGTLLGSLYNGSCDNSADDPQVACTYFSTAFPGGTQANGGVDDFNGYDMGGEPPAGRYATSWTTCTSGNSYCGTGDSGAAAKDNATGLVWSYPCAGVACASWDTETNSATLTTDCMPAGDCAYMTTDTLYTWSAGGANNDSKTASELCASHSGWSLPHQKQLMQAYINGSYGNLEPQGVYRYYWSSTVVSFNITQESTWAWLINLSDGYAYDNRETRAHSIRCVR